MNGYRKIADLPYRRVLLMDPSDGSPFIAMKGCQTLHRPHEYRDWDIRQRISERLREIVEQNDQENLDRKIPMMSDLEKVAALNAAIAMNPDVQVRPRRYLEEF